MQDAFAHCEELVRAADKDRFLATLFAPAERRGGLFALYAFNLEVARVREVVREPLAGEVRLQWWRDAINATGEPAIAHPVAAALLATIERFRLPRQPLIELIDARQFDLYDEVMTTLGGLDRYAAQTSAALFALAASILGQADAQPLTQEAGLAYAITGLLRAFPRHAARRQLYVPLEVLHHHGVEVEHVWAGRATPELAAVLADMRAHAEGHLRNYARARGSVPRMAAPAFLPVELVPLYLDRLGRARDPFAILEVSQWRRQWVLWRAARRHSAATA